MPLDAEPGTVEVALRNHLDAHGLLDDPLASAALALARRLDRDADTLAGMASALRSLDVVVAKLRPSDIDGAGFLDVLRFLRAVRHADADVADQIADLLTPEIRAEMKAAKFPTNGRRVQI